MEWKKMAFIALFALLALPASAAVVGPDVRVASSHLDELTPGARANLTLVLENLGAFACAYKTTTQIQVSSPLSVEGLDSQIVDKFCTPETASVTFTIRADPNAAAASYPITLLTTYESEYRAAYSAYNTVYARVEGSPELTAHVTKTNPVTVYPGDDFSLDAAIDNVGAYRADSLTLELAAEEPLEVKASAKTQSAATLQARSSTTKTFYLHAQKNAQAKEYLLSLAATYLDENGEWKKKTIPLQVALSAKADFEASDGNSLAFIDSRNNELKFKLENTGTDDAVRVRAKLLPSFPFSTQGSVQYVERLAPGQSTDIVFYVDVDKEGVPGTYSLDLSASFENDDGDKFTDTIPVSAKTARTPMLNAVFINYWYAWAAAALVAAALVFRRLKTKKTSAEK